MFLFRGIFARFGLANTLSLVSLVISITCFAFMARISQQNAKINLNKIEPKVIIANNETIKVAIDKSNYDLDSTIYDNIVQDIDKISDSKEEDRPTVKTKSNLIKTEVAEIATVDPDVAQKKEEIVAKSTLTEAVKKQNIKTNVQLGIFKSHREAVSAWFKMTEQYSVLNNLRYHIVSKPSTGDTYIYALQVKEKNGKNAEKLVSVLQQQGLKTILVEDPVK